MVALLEAGPASGAAIAARLKRRKAEVLAAIRGLCGLGRVHVQGSGRASCYALGGASSPSTAETTIETPAVLQVAPSPPEELDPDSELDEPMEPAPAPPAPVVAPVVQVHRHRHRRRRTR